VQKFFNEAQEYIDRHTHSILNFRRSISTQTNQEGEAQQHASN